MTRDHAKCRARRGSYRTLVLFLAGAPLGCTEGSVSPDASSSPADGWAADAPAAPPDAPTSADPDAHAPVRLPPTDLRAVPQPSSSAALGSSSALRVTWSEPAPFHHLRVRALDADGVLAAEATVAGGLGVATLSDLRSASPYAVSVEGCPDDSCAEPLGATTSARTAEEVWQLQGTGASTRTLTRVVSDGNARVSATRFGDSTGAEARIQLFYGPQPSPGSRTQALVVASTAPVPRPDDPSSYLAFERASEPSGISTDDSVAAPLVSQIGTGLGLPLSEALGARVRLFFEARGADGRTRILSLDSQDGLGGRDFHPGESTQCASTADYTAGGPCEPVVVIPVEGDAGGNPRIRDARQMKIGFPALEDWRWDGSTGFMVFTTDAIDGCSGAPGNQAYALWDGERWIVQYGPDGCPRLFPGARAPTPLHLGHGRYKLYFSTPDMASGRLPGSTIPFLGPKQVLYADATRTGDPDVVEFEDWEAVADARHVSFLWPDGSPLDDRAVGYIDDYDVLAPTGDLSLQVLYVAISDGVAPPIAAAAVLVNP